MGLKLQTTVVGEQLLDLGGPAVSAFQVSCLALGGIAHKTAPWIDVLNRLEGFWSHQDINAVLTKTPAAADDATQNDLLSCTTDRTIRLGAILIVAVQLLNEVVLASQTQASFQK